MIVVDEFNFIGQHKRSDPKYLDFGDSSNRTAIMYVCDRSFFAPLEKLVDDEGLCSRHHKYPWATKKNFSRDQVVPFMLGMKAYGERTGATYITKKIFWSHAKRLFLCQNTYRNDGTGPKFPDILAPDHILHLILCARVWPFYIWGLIGYPWLIASIYWSTRVKPEAEQNQIICQVLAAGKPFLKLYLKWHPDFKKNLRNYWGGWRDQIEMADVMIDYIEEAAK